MKKISIILCTFNEVNFIEKALRLINKKFKKSEIIIIDDNSKDGTLEKLKKVKKIKFKLFVRKNKRGLASALAMGLNKSKGDYIGFFDTNMFDQVNYFKKAILYLERGYDISVLSRYVNGGGDKRVYLRNVTSYFINKVSRFVLNVPLNDFTSGIFIAKKKVFRSVKISPVGHGEFAIDFIYKAYKKGLKIKEIPYVQKKDTNFTVSKSYPNLLKFLYLGFKYFLAILHIKFNNIK